MRSTPVVTLVMAAGLLLAWGQAHAQVTTNDSALDSLAPRQAPAARPQAPRRAIPKPATPATPTAPSQAVKPAPAATAKPVIPVSPPAILALPPAVAVPLAHPPPPPVIPLTDDAPGAVTPLPTGLRVTFGADRFDVSPATVAAITAFANTQMSQTGGINILAYATGSADDPSTPRRLALERALTARAVLLKAGIPSPRIYPRALGPSSGDEPDRVEIVTGPQALTVPVRAAGAGK